MLLKPNKKRKVGVFLNGVHRKLHFRNGLVWMVGLTTEIKLRVV